MAKVKLNDVAIEARETWKQNKTDVPVVGLEHLEPDEIWLKRWDLNPDENTFTKGFKKGQLLFGRRRAYQKKMSVASCDGICSGDITVIAARPEKMLPELLPFYLRTDSFFDFAVRGSGGSLSPRVKWSHISDYEFDLPPMEEQKKLAELLWAANDLKEKYKKAITATDEMLKAKFREMTYGVDYVCLGEIASEWIKGQSFKKNAIVKDGLHKCIHYGELFTKYGPVIENVISCTNESIIRSSKRGDILFPASDVTPMGLSRCSALMLDNVLLGGDIICMRPLSNNDAQFISYAINQEISQLLKCVSGSIIKHFSANRLKNVSIPLPPLALQREFVAIAEKAEAAKTALKKSIADIDQVMKGLING